MKIMITIVGRPCGSIFILLVPVFFEETEGVVIAEIFKLNEGTLTIMLDNCLHKLIDEFIISGTRDTPMSQSNVVFILQKTRTTLIKGE